MGDSEFTEFLEDLLHRLIVLRVLIEVFFDGFKDLYESLCRTALEILREQFAAEVCFREFLVAVVDG